MGAACASSLLDERVEPKHQIDNPRRLHLAISVRNELLNLLHFLCHGLFVIVIVIAPVALIVVSNTAAALELATVVTLPALR
jgi:hypothetical protein